MEVIAVVVVVVTVAGTERKGLETEGAKQNKMVDEEEE
jgi:hypothetical protein